MAGLLALWLMAWIYWGLGPRLVYMARWPEFSLAPEFARSTLAEVGGLAHYGGAFFGQLDYWPIAGTLVRLAQVVAVGLLARGIARRAGCRRAAAVGYATVIPYLLLAGRHDVSPALGLMVGGMLALVLLWQRLPALAPAVRYMLFLVILAIDARALAGAAGSAPLYANLLGLAALALVVDRPKLGWWPLYLLPAMAAAALLAPHLPPIVLSTPPDPAGITVVLSALLMVAAPLSLLVLRALPEASEPREAKVSPRLLLLGGIGLLQLLTTRFAANQPALEQARRDERYLAGRWQAILAEERVAPSKDLLAMHDVGAALSHTGRLSEELFEHPLMREALLIPLRSPATLSCRMRLADQCLAIGRVNDAEHGLHNSLPYIGANPYLLQRLAMVYLVKDEPLAARLYLNALSYDVVWHGWAQRYLRHIAAGRSLGELPEVAALRANMMPRDDMFEVTNVAEGSDDVVFNRAVSLRHLLDANPRNVRALEYLMAIHLLACCTDELVRDLPRARAAGLTQLPEPWAEAVLFWVDTNHTPPPLAGLTISNESCQRYERYKQILAEHDYVRSAARGPIAQALPGTWLAFQAQVEGSP